MNEIDMFWETPEYRNLIGQWKMPNGFDLLGLSRDERAFTKIICAAFDKSYVGVVASQMFLRAFVEKLRDKDGLGNVTAANELIGVLLNSDCSIVDIRVETEKPVVVGEYRGYIDLLVSVNVEVNAEAKRYYIIVENKVGSQEHRIGEHIDAPWQTVAYKSWCDEQYGRDSTVYLFLSPSDDVVCHCENFLRINYQDIVDILSRWIGCVPVEMYSIRTLFEEFIHVLGPSLNNKERVVTAMTEEERNMLREFWANESNREQVMALLEIMVDEQRAVGMDENSRVAIQRACNQFETDLSFRIGDRIVSEEEFRDRFREVRQSRRILTYANGSVETNVWVCQNLGEAANIRANVQSQMWWRQRVATGLVSVVCVIDEV